MSPVEETDPQEMKNQYTAERNVQIVISLMKQYGIRKVIASPGTTNYTLVASLQQDPFFQMYSSAEERSAAYMACGLAVESGEPVAITCTGATASRNYMPGLTEAYYRKIPVLAITSLQNTSKISNNIPQVIDRSSIPNDVANFSVLLRSINTKEDELSCQLLANRAISSLFRRGGGPVHINLETTYSPDFSVEELPQARKIQRVCLGDEFPELPSGRIAVVVGAHKKWSPRLLKAVDAFCDSHDAVVFSEHTGNYCGKYRFFYTLYQSQSFLDKIPVDLTVHIGDVSGEYAMFGIKAPKTWRVNPDGEMRDTFGNLDKVFEMEEAEFFERYAGAPSERAGSTLKLYTEMSRRLYAAVPELPFSNLWMASVMAGKIPEGSVLHLAILNSLRSWNFFDTHPSVRCYSNTGGFGIDGCMSSLVGASLADSNRLYFGVIGDLAFFYDMNALGNRSLGKNVRILLVNNGKGAEFRLFSHPANRFGDNADKFIAAGGHYAGKSPTLVKNYAQDLGFEYLCASNKEEFLQNCDRFLTPEITDRPMLFEAFVDAEAESEALKAITSITLSAKKEFYKTIRGAIPQEGINLIKKILK